MSYPHNNQTLATEPSEASLYEPPVALVINRLLPLLNDPEFANLEAIMIEPFEEVDDLLAEILVNSHRFSSYALNRLFEEIDQALDEHRRSGDIF